MARGEGRKSQKRGAFGTAHKLPSGRYRAMYLAHLSSGSMEVSK